MKLLLTGNIGYITAGNYRGGVPRVSDSSAWGHEIKVKSQEGIIGASDAETGK